MSESESKRLKTEEPSYELIYWPGLPGRGEFVRLLFEEAGVPYIDHAKNPSKAVSTVSSWTAGQGSGDDSNPPIFASPALKHGDLVISQLSNILLYLAPKLGLAPKEGNAVYHLNAIVATILDGLVNELHDTHHPVSMNLTYEEQMNEAKRRSADYLKNRLPKFFNYFQQLLDSKTSGSGPWLYGDSMTYADIVLFQGLHGTLFAFPKTCEKLRKSGKYDGVFKLFEAVGETPNIKEYMASDRRQAYSNGIWRHYPELEE